MAGTSRVISSAMDENHDEYQIKFESLFEALPRLRLGYASATPHLRHNYALASISCEHCRSSRNNPYYAPRHIIYYNFFLYPTSQENIDFLMKQLTTINRLLRYFLSKLSEAGKICKLCASVEPLETLILKMSDGSTLIPLVLCVISRKIIQRNIKRFILHKRKMYQNRM